MSEKTLHPTDNKFHKGNSADGKHYWLTPPELMEQLQAEFGFDFDACPYPKPDDFDGLDVDTEWGNPLYCNLWSEKFNAQSAENRSLKAVLPLVPRETGGLFDRHVASAIASEIATEPPQSVGRNTSPQKSFDYFPLVCADAQNVGLFNHLTDLILLLVQGSEMDSTPIVESVGEPMRRRRWPEGDPTLRREILSRFQKFDTESQRRGDSAITPEVLLETIGVEEMCLYGPRSSGTVANYTLATSASIADQADFLRRTILYLYATLIAREQSKPIWSQRVSRAIVQSIGTCQASGVAQRRSSGLRDIFPNWLKLSRPESCYVNPPFGSIMHQGPNDKKPKKKGPTAWVRKAIAEAKQGKRVILVYPIDKWILMLLAAGAEVRNLGDVKWCATEDGKPGKGTGRHIACFILGESQDNNQNLPPTPE